MIYPVIMKSYPNHRINANKSNLIGQWISFDLIQFWYLIFFFRVTNDDEIVPTDLTNGQSPPPPAALTEENKQQDAYCHLCERSFCNKYFLKTHFAKKHGVLNLTSPLSDPPKTQSSPSSPIPDQPVLSEDYCEVRPSNHWNLLLRIFIF